MKKVGLYVAILSGIATIIGVMYSIFCTKDYSEDIKKAVVEIKTQRFVMEQMPDSLFNNQTIKQSREIQQKILSLKDRIDNIDFAPRENEDTPTGIYRYLKEMENFEAMCNEVITFNDKFSNFVSSNPQYSTMFNLSEYKKKTDREQELISVIISGIQASHGKGISPEKKLNQIKRALNSKEMLDFLQIRTDVLLQVFDYMNKIQKEVKLNYN